MALVDGRSQLTVQGNVVQWQHFDFVAPGRHGGEAPTLVECEPWFPIWPDIPDAANFHCDGCVSSALNPEPPLAPMQGFIGIEEIASGCRQSCEVVGYPTAENDFKLTIEFNDNALAGPSWYQIDILVQTPTP
jgi:hypothetical protein